MGKLFEKMYIGNPSKRDLTRKDIQRQSGLSLFFTVVRVRGLNLLWLNLLYSLFLLPTYIVVFLGLYQYGITINTENAMTFADVVWYMYLLFPCMLIAAPGKVGFTNVLHRWASDEHAWFSDFWTGIKMNWKQSLIVTVINYVVLFALIYYAYFYASRLNAGAVEGMMSYVFQIGLYLLLGCIFVYFMIHLYVFPMLVRYKLKIKEIYKYSFILAFKNILGSVICIIFLAVFAYLLFILPYMMYTIPVVAIVIGYLIVYVHMGRVFKKYVFLEEKSY